MDFRLELIHQKFRSHHSSVWFWLVFAAVIVHGNNFSWLDLLYLKSSSGRLLTAVKGFLILSSLVCKWYFEQSICNFSLAKRNYSKVLRSAFLTGQSCLLKSFVRNLILMILLSAFSSRTYLKHDTVYTTPAQKLKFSIKDFFCKCDQIRSKLRIRSHLLKKLLMENFIFCVVKLVTCLILFWKSVIMIFHACSIA